jgi:hypothetical protein
MRRRHRDSARRLRITVDRLPRHTKDAMLRGIERNRIIVGAYVDPSSGGVCPMLAAHRNGGRTSVAAFARAWDDYTNARRPRRATRREVNALRSMLEQSLNLDGDFERTPITELAAQIRTERAELARCAGRSAPSAPPEPPTPREVDVAVPEPDGASIRVRRRQPADDLLGATERELTAADDTTGPA